VTAGCGGGSASGPPKRPSTAARISIVSPAANATVGTDSTLEIALTGGRLVSRTTGPLTPDEGHLHITVDGMTLVMTEELVRPLLGLAPGEHSVQVEFVAVDHGPFANRPVAAALFTVA
jgi:hypothetical protein